MPEYNLLFNNKLPMIGRPLPIANIPHCGGFIMALNSVMSNIPRLDMLMKTNKIKWLKNNKY